jgi:hypothetical protein
VAQIRIDEDRALQFVANSVIMLEIVDPGG